MAKQNITLSLEKALIKRARGVAAQRGLSVSAYLAEKLTQETEIDQDYELAKASAFSLLDAPVHLGGQGIRNREALYDRQGLRRH